MKESLTGVGTTWGWAITDRTKLTF